MRRLHLIEIEDQPWCPRGIRDALTDYLQFTLRWTEAYAPISERLARAIIRAQAQIVIDLCSGAAGPWLTLEPAMRKHGTQVSVCLTDKFPNLEAFQRAREISDGRLHYLSEPVDATCVSGRLMGFRTLFTSFHHFSPPAARAVLCDAVAQRQAIGVFEVTQRSLKAVLLTLLAPLTVLVVTPAIRPFRWSRWLWTYLVPVIPLVVLFDGLVSCLRTYTPSELRALANSLGPIEYQWEIGQEPGHKIPVPVTYAIGVPSELVAKAQT